MAMAFLLSAAATLHVEWLEILFYQHLPISNGKLKICQYG
jgi:hypothetical protein